MNNPVSFAQDRSFFIIQLINQSLFTHVERAAWVVVGRIPLRTIVETPASRMTGDRAAQVRQKILGGWLPVAIAPAKWLLMVDRHCFLKLAGNCQQFPRANFRLLR